VIDRTYSCRVQVRGAVPAVDVGAYVTLPPFPSGAPRLALAQVTTVRKTIEGRFLVPQVFFRAAKSSFMVDRTACAPSSRHVPLRPAGLASNGTATASFEGGFNERCVSSSRVLVHVRVSLKDDVPTRALLAVRNGDAKSRPLAFVRWSPSRITSYLATSCVPIGP